MTSTGPNKSWGEPPWEVNFMPKTCSLPRQLDVAIVGGGFTGLAAAAWLRKLAPEKVVALFERHWLGSGGSGRTGGIALAETATGDLPGLGDVLEGFRGTLRDLEIKCDAGWNGVYEIAHGRKEPSSALQWQDSGPLCAVNEVPGGSIDPGQLLDGLAGAAERLGAFLFECSPVTDIHFEKPLRLLLPEAVVRAERVFLATNACALELTGLGRTAQPKFTLALATEPLRDEYLKAIGLQDRKPFYTVDLPYLWGRTLLNNGVIFGSGLVHVKNWRELDALDVRSGETARLLASLENRVRGLHPVLRDVQFSHRWGGPILLSNHGCPFFHAHPLSPNVIVLGGFTGQGVTLSVHLGRWAAEVILGQKCMPAWDAKPGNGEDMH